jgi:predicted RNA methylase
MQMRLEGVAKAGFYPTPESQVALILHHLEFEGPARLFDPCAGEGLALGQIQASAAPGSVSYGIEIDRARAEVARRTLDRVVACGYESARVAPASMQCLFLNPPYDQRHAQGGLASRSELYFLRDLSKYVAPNGILVFVVPRYVLGKDLVQALLNRYTDLAMYRFEDGEYDVFAQVVVFGRRRDRLLKSNQDLTPTERQVANEMVAVHKNASLPIPILGTGNKTWHVPEATDLQEPILFRGALLDETELLQDLATSEVFRIAENLLMSSADGTQLKRPLLPFRRTHLATLIAAGALDGAIGVGADRHLVVGITRKRVLREITEDERGNEVVLDTEQYVTVVRTVEPDGRILDLQ